MRGWLVIAPLLAGCNQVLGVGDVKLRDDGGGGDDEHDARIVDARLLDAEIPDAEPVPDAEPAATLQGQIAVLDVTLTDPAAVAISGGIRGAVINAAWQDLTGGGGEVVFGTGALASCTVVQFDPSHLPNPPLDASPVTIAGNGLLKTVGPCSYDNTLGLYRCVSHQSTSTAITATDLANPPTGVVSYAFSSQTFPTAPQLVGSQLLVNGFTNAAFNAASSPLQIVSQGGTTTLVVSNVAGEGQGTQSTTGAFTVLNGVGPVAGVGSNADFLGTGSTEVHITKAANGVWPAIDQTISVLGEGYDLDDGSALVHGFPAIATAQSYTCAGAGGNCGSDTTETLEATIIIGHATRKSVAGLPAFQMPVDVPGVDTWLDWNCVFLLSTSATMAQEAVQAVLDFGPTRIEQRVFRVAGAIVDDGGGLNQTSILVGHGLIGHTDPP